MEAAAAVLARASLKRLEAVERDAALRECLAETDLEKVNWPALHQALQNGREKGASELLLTQVAARLSEWERVQAYLEKKYEGVPTWIVVNPGGFVNVRTEKSAGAAILARKEPGEIIRAFPENDGWVRLHESNKMFGYMLVKSSDGTELLKRHDGASAEEGGEQTRLTWAPRFFQLDRLAREGFTFLLPEFHNSDLMVEEMDDLGHKMLEIGHRLYEDGTMSCNTGWDKEESPEFDQSLNLWEEALKATGLAEFNRLLQKASALAIEGYTQTGNLAPRLASLRWCICLSWMAARSAAVEEVSVCNSFGQISKKRCKEVCHAAKHHIFEWLRSLCKEYPVLTIFDFDLIGHGVWHDYRREPLPRRADNDWYRRCIEYDIVKLCHQALQLPPLEMNPSAAFFVLVQPYLTPDWILPPPEAPMHILRKHNWFFELLPSNITDLHTKAWVDGKILHIERAPEFQHDFSDPKVRTKVERGEPLGKGDQEDGLPGAVHGSVALLYAAMMTRDQIKHVQFYSGLLDVDDFFETLLKYGPPLLTLDLSGCYETFDVDLLSTVRFAGGSLTVLDLSECGVDEDMVQTLIEVVEALPCLKHLDLAHNKLDAHAAVVLVSTLCENRIDIPSIRLDGNPLGDVEDFRAEVAAALTARGEQVVAGGEILLHAEDDMVRWVPKLKQGSLAYRLRENEQPPKVMAIKEVRNMAQQIKKKLDKFEKSDPAAKSSGGKDWLERRRQLNQQIFDSDLLSMYKSEIQHRIKQKEEAEVAKQAANEAADKADRERNAGGLQPKRR